MNNMREILFKAKRKNWKELPKEDWWVEGYYCKIDETTYCVEEDYKRFPVPTHHYILQETMTDWGLPNRFLQFEIDPNTLCQYTGLTDKSGRKIWENDIVKFDDEIWSSSYTSCGMEYDSYETENYGVVGYCDYSAKYDFTKYKYNENQVEADLHENHDIEFAEFLKEHEVIGNIFDNPELLEATGSVLRTASKARHRLSNI